MFITASFSSALSVVKSKLCDPSKDSVWLINFHANPEGSVFAPARPSNHRHANHANGLPAQIQGIACPVQPSPPLHRLRDEPKRDSR